MRTQWVSPIFKKGAKCEPANYRPVSLTWSHLDEHEILSPFQHGFRGKHSCESQLTVTYQDLACLNDHKMQVDIGILDFSKAFDVVPHYRLLNKLQFYGINEVTCNWIQHVLAGRYQKVMVDGVFSKEESVDSGVPQGTVLGPYFSSFSLTTSPTTPALALQSAYLQTIALYTGQLDQWKTRSYCKKTWLH